MPPFPGERVRRRHALVRAWSHRDEIVLEVEERPLARPTALPSDPLLLNPVEFNRHHAGQHGHAGGYGREGGVASVSRLPSGSRTCASVE